MIDQVAPAGPPVTSRPSFSFYVPADRLERIKQAATFGDALTVAGPKGPDIVRRLRDCGFEKPVLFDGLGYAGKELPAPDRWVAAQANAGADRALLPGAFVPWDKEGCALLTTVIEEQARIAADLDATVLVALDARWLAKRYEMLTDALTSVEGPVAVVLADRADPLADGRAVMGLRWLAARLHHLSILRSDHGALGAVAFGADHASIGLTTSTRHFAASGMKPFRLRDDSARLFVRQLLDWFRAAQIAGWSAAGTDLLCALQCCEGGTLDRYLDADRDAMWHNMNALADFAEYVVNAPATDRSTVFLDVCRSAASRYGLAGIHGPEQPKAQLTSWVLS